MRLLGRLRRVNTLIGLAVGGVLVLACGLIILEIVMRRVAFGMLGGTDEISGYVMAGVASWAGAYALIERAHIRIDLLHRRLPTFAKAGIDIAVLIGLCVMSGIVVAYGWEVVSRSFTGGSTANTPLETPLWIPQSVWFAGWVWFAIASFTLLVLTLWAVVRGEWNVAAEVSGPESDETVAIGQALQAAGRDVGTPRSGDRAE